MLMDFAKAHMVVFVGMGYHMRMKASILGVKYHVAMGVTVMVHQRIYRRDH